VRGGDDYDVFLSYSRADSAAAETLRGRLIEAGLRAFLDRYMLPAGQPWQPWLERRLASCRALVVLVGGAFDEWQQREIQLGLDRQASAAKAGQAFPVIPVLLPGLANAAAPLGRFLNLNTWVDLRSGLDEPQALRRLVAGVQGAAIDAAGAPTIQNQSAAIGLSIVQMVKAARACRRVEASAMNGGHGEASQSFEMLHKLEDITELEERLRLEAEAKRLAEEEDRLRREPVARIPPMLATRPETDLVDVIAFAPPSAARRKRFLVQAFLGKTGEDEDITRVAALASDPTTSKRSVATLDVELAYGDRVDIKLEAANLSVEEPEQSLIWRRKPRSCSFLVTVPEDFAGDRAFVQARVFRQATPIGRIAFSILIEAEKAEVHSEGLSPVGELSRAYRRAFLSYASSDRPEVIKRAQALKAANIDFFMDLLSLEPGQRWEKRLYSEIDQCDLFVLFWSNAARNSTWVSKEIQYALDCIKKHTSPAAARPEIHPIIVEGPPPPPPPDLLSHLHFNDPFLYLIASMEKLTAGRPAN
jgi:hypothetical protein